MTDDYIDEDKDFGAEYYEDPEMTIESHWRWVLPILVLLVLPVGATWLLHETSRNGREPLLNQMQTGVPTAGEAGAVGTSGRDRSPAEASLVYSIHELETITGLVDRRPLVGRKVELRAPVAAVANDQAFWIGEQDNRLLVVPTRDRRDSIQRQAGEVTGNDIAKLDTGKTAVISGIVQQMPLPEQAYSWGLTTEDREELAARGVYLRADRVSVQ